MKITKSYKILSLIMVLALAFACFIFTSKTASADEAITSSDYFTVTSESETTSVATLDGQSLVLDMANGSTAKFKRKLDISNFSIAITIDDKVSAFDFTFTYQVADPNGFDADNKALGQTCTLTKTYDATVSINVANGTAIYDGTQQPVTVNGNLVISFSSNKLTVNSKDFYLENNCLPKVVDGAVIGDISFKVTSTENTSVKVDSISQGSKVEDFVLETDATSIKYDVAKSVIVASEAFASTESKILGEKTAIAFTEYSVVPSTYKASDFKVEEVAGKVLVDDNSKNVWFLEEGNVNYSIYVLDGETKITVATKTVNVINDDDVTAPEYVANAEAIKNFNKALYNNTREEYEINGQTEELYVRLGSNSNLEIPSMAGFVADSVTNYDSLTKTVYYRTNDSDWTSTSSMKIPLNAIGKYDFFVLFGNKANEKMEKSDFIDDDGNIVAGMENYIFSFVVYNDAPISITATNSVEKAYKGISYTVEDFKILAMNYTTQYALYYAESETATEWEEILPLSSLTEGEEDYEKYAGYAYNGSLTFTPVKTGYYKIVAQVFENESVRSESAEVMVRATNTPKVVKPANTWARDNVWSIVFLSIGTLSLIGIIVVLVIPEKKKEI